MFSQTHRLLFLSIIVILLSTTISACSSQSSTDDVHLNMASMDLMPAEVHASAVSVQEAYQFNVANPEIMKEIPCYCGCGSIGHTSNYDCYVSDVDDAGNPSTGSGQAITFDNHALGCSICVDITQDVMRMLKDGKSPGEARASIDATYSKYGPSNIP